MQHRRPLEVALAREERPAQRPDPRRLREVPLRRILRHDNLAFLLVSFGTVLFAFALVVWITGSTPGGRGRPSRPLEPGEGLAAVAFTGVLMASLCTLAGLRAWRVHRLFQIGEVVEATLAAISHAKGYSNLRLDYAHRATRYSARRSIRRSAHAQALQPGDSLAILVDPDHPKRLVLAELYDR